jgi:hypothetical protein
MPDNFAITAASTTVRLDEAKTGTISFTVTNQTPLPKRGRAKITAKNTDDEQWITVVGEAERGFVGHGTQQYTVNIAAPTGALAGTHSFSLDMLGTENPDEDYTQGPSVSFTIPEVKPLEKQPKVRKMPWWVPLVAAVVVGGIVGGVVVGLITSRPSTHPVVNLQPYAGTWFNDATAQPGDLVYLSIAPSGTALSLHSFGQCGQATCDLGVIAATCTSDQCTASIQQGERMDNLTLTLSQDKAPALQIVDDWTGGSDSGTSTMNFHQATALEIQAQRYVGTWVYAPPANFNYLSLGDPIRNPQVYQLSITRQQTSLLIQSPEFCGVLSGCSPQVGNIQLSATAAPEFKFSFCDSQAYYLEDLTLTLSADGTTLSVHDVLTQAHRVAGGTCAISGPMPPPFRILDYTMRQLVVSNGQTTFGESVQVVTEADTRMVNI